MKYEVSGELPAGGYVHPETGRRVGEWCVINPDVSKEEAMSKSQWARSRIIAIVCGGGSLMHAHMLCDAMNADPKHSLSTSKENPKWRFDDE